MQMKSTMLGVGFGLWLTVMPVAAHHAFTAEFDSNQPISLSGTVTKIEWVNPHSWLHVDVKGRDGETVNWAFELGAPNALFRRGWRKDSIQTGVEVQVTGYRAKNGKAVANGRTIKLPGGQELFAGSSGTGAPLDGADSSAKQ